MNDNFNPNWENNSKIPYFRRCVIQNFPFIEKDFDAVTDYQLLSKVVAYLNKVIEQQNITSHNINELYRVYELLKNYIDHYFENLDVQEEINNKLDSMAIDGSLTALIKNYVDPIYQVYEQSINNTVSIQNTRITAVENELSSVASGSPIPVSSTSDMTDTTRTYLNTTNGKWYYYDGDSWKIGGTYQSTGLADNSVSKNNLDSELKNAIFHSISTEIDKTTGEETHFIKDANTETPQFTSASTVYSLVIPIESSTKYIVQKIQSARFALYTSQLEPSIGVAITDYVQTNSATKLEITSGANDNYLTILFYNNLYDTLTKSNIFNSMKIYKGSVQETETQAEYLLDLIGDNIIADKYINLICDKHLGSLEKGYIAISCDDGTNSLADDTIPLFLGYKTTYNKNIPLTMGLMSNSQIFRSDNTSRLATVLSFINNTGSSVAIHGTNSYTTYTVDELYDFLDTQKEYLTTNLVAPTSIIYPNHDYNKRTSTVAGSYYGVCATGGNNFPITYDGNSKLAGPRSNMYTLYRFSLFNDQMTTQKIKDAIDYAYDHHMIFMPFFHDNTLHNDYDRCKGLLDYCVNYANSKRLTFINIGDIPNII